MLGGYLGFRPECEAKKKLRPPASRNAPNGTIPNIAGQSRPVRASNASAASAASAIPPVTASLRRAGDACPRVRGRKTGSCDWLCLHASASSAAGGECLGK